MKKFIVCSLSALFIAVFINIINNSTVGANVLDSTVKDRPLYKKEVFLTFDDGPSANTLKVLRILDENKVKATFFVLGRNAEKNPSILKAVYKDGMDIENHSYSHQYSMYKSVQATLNDFKHGNAVIKSILGIEPYRFIRFPGGSDNTVSKPLTMVAIRNAIVQSGKEYVDWNSACGDGDSKVKSAVALKNAVISQMSVRNFGVVLFHDSSNKATTVAALPAILSYLKSHSFVFRTFKDLTPTEEKEMIKRKIINRGYKAAEAPLNIPGIPK